MFEGKFYDIILPTDDDDREINIRKSELIKISPNKACLFFIGGFRCPPSISIMKSFRWCHRIIRMFVKYPTRLSK